MDEQYGQLIEPQKVSFSFGAPGWYLLAAALLLLLGFISWVIYHYYKKNAYRRSAIKLIDSIGAQIPTNGSSAALYQTNMLLKRIAITKYGRQATTPVYGLDWIQFLNKSARKELFNKDDDQLLQRELYAGQTSDNSNKIAAFLTKAKEWTNRHS